MLTEGKILHRAIKLSPYKIDEVIDITGISRGKLYDMFKLSLINDDDKELLKKLKIDLDFSTKSTKIENSEIKEIENFEKKYVHLLEKQNAELEKRVKDMDLLNRQTAYNIPTLIDEIKRMSKLIESLNGVEHLVRQALETGFLKKK